MENISKTTKVQITMTIGQARTMMRAMDFFMRMLMGQFQEIEHLFFSEEFDPVFERKRDYQTHNDVDYYLRMLKKSMYPTLEYNASWGITGKPCPERATMIYDMYKAMDYAISWHQNSEGGWTVNFDKPMHWYKELPLPEVKVFDEV